MKSNIKILVIILLQIFLASKLISEEIEFKATNIEISNDQNLTIANNGTALIKDDGIIVEGEKIKYFRNESLLIIDKGKVSSLDQNFEINSNLIEYKISKSELNFSKEVKILDKSNDLLIDTDEIKYDVKNQQIKSKSSSVIKDKLGNLYQVKDFNYSIKDKLIKLNNLKVFDPDKNTFIVDMAFLDLKKNELIAKDVGLNFKISKNSENEPRLKGRSLINNEKETIVKKGTFTFCKKREKCPPWEMGAEEIIHDKEKKIIKYKNANLKIYDKKVFYFPKFFHPDPTVKRQTGFLIPRLMDNSTTGFSLNLPYFFVMAENKDITINPRFYSDNKLLLQSEFRQKNKNSDHIADVSQYMSSKENSKSHLFYNYEKNYETNNFDDVELKFRVEQVSDETYLKAYRIESPIINDTSNLINSVSLNFFNQDSSINTNLDIYEDLTKQDSDKYEYVPNFNFSRVINEYYSFNSNGYYKNYNTNITEKILINNFEFQSFPNFFDNGIIHENKFFIKNVNSEAKNSEKFKNKSSISIAPTLQTMYSYPLKRETTEYNNTIIPKLSLRLSTPHTKDYSKSDRKINYDNIFNLDRLGIADANEGGVSATYGYEYTKVDKSNLEQKVKIALANNLRVQKNEDLPNNSNLGDKVSDFVGLLAYKPNNFTKLNYNFSLKNNLDEKNYELFGFEFYLNNLSTKVEYLNENNSNLKTSYIQNEVRYNLNENNKLIFETRENKEKSFTEFYNLIYQYQNDCLTAGLEYNKEYYSDQDLKPSENLFFKISIIPFGGFNSPNLR
tara:strand:- start:2937 stop:5297 length:2361 start_codon:yes stop_codon:yes gene_type:complete